MQLRTPHENAAGSHCAVPGRVVSTASLVGRHPFTGANRQPRRITDAMPTRQRKRPARPPRGARKVSRWSQRVTEHSDALDLESKVFTKPPREMARSLKRSAERSRRRKSSPFRSAMSMLTFYENRAGRTLPASRRRAIQRAKQELRRLYGRPAGSGKASARGRKR
jgi:hypothetical protein